MKHKMAMRAVWVVTVLAIGLSVLFALLQTQ
jgi:hypothetical protein